MFASSYDLTGGLFLIFYQKLILFFGVFVQLMPNTTQCTGLCFCLSRPPQNEFTTTFYFNFLHYYSNIKHLINDFVDVSHGNCLLWFMTFQNRTLPTKS